MFRWNNDGLSPDRPIYSTTFKFHYVQMEQIKDNDKMFLKLVV